MLIVPNLSNDVKILLHIEGVTKKKEEEEEKKEKEEEEEQKKKILTCPMSHT
jgi:hypothetical protein